MKIDTAFKNLLKKRDHKDLTGFLEAAKEQANSEHSVDDTLEALRAFLSQTGNVDIAINFAEQEIIYRDELFAETTFYIQPTAFECREEVLILGHRLVPFVNPTFPCNQLSFQTANELPLEQRTEKFTFEEFEIYFRLLPPYESKYFDIDIESSQVSLGVIDLAPWLGHTTLKEDDWIEVEPVEGKKGAFSLSLISSRKKAELGLLLRRKDKLLADAIEFILDQKYPVLPVDLSLFWAYAQFPKNVRPLSMAGSPIGPFLSQLEDINFYNDGEFTYLQTVDYYESFWEDALAGEFLPDLDQMGEAEDIDGIFAELGSTFSQTIVEGFMVNHLHKYGEIRQDSIMQTLFRQDYEPFYVEQQETNFKKALTELQEIVEQKWDHERLALPVQQLLAKALDFKVEFVNFLREIDDNLISPEELDFAELLQLQPVDHLIDEIILLIIQKEPISAKEGQTIGNQLNMARDLFRNFKNNFLDKL